jgi:lipoprotein-anchoring transpeptidase ErfK/SrfK
MNKLEFTAVAALALILAPGAVETASAAAEEVNVAFTDPAGTVVISTSERRLYLVERGGRALRYTVGVGRAGRQWRGQSSIAAKFLEPNWVPPAAIRADSPNLPAVIPGGSPANPMGAAAMTLAGTDYAIHGTNAPGSIGGFVSYGCIRMFNADISDLYSRVRVGTPVIVRP